MDDQMAHLRRSWAFGARFRPYLTGLLLAFVALKIFGVINWNWLWVLAPLWMPFGFAVALFGIAIVLVGLAWLLVGR